MDIEDLLHRILVKNELMSFSNTGDQAIKAQPLLHRPSCHFLRSTQQYHRPHAFE